MLCEGELRKLRLALSPFLIFSTIWLFPLGCVKSWLVSKYLSDLRPFCVIFEFPFCFLYVFYQNCIKGWIVSKYLPDPSLLLCFSQVPGQRVASFKVLTRSWAALCSTSVISLSYCITPFHKSNFKEILRHRWLAP